MSDIFCVISAVGVDYGVFSYSERIEQLKQTINSIKHYKPNAYICLMEISDTPIQNEDYVFFQSMVDKVFLLHDHFFVNEILIKMNHKDTDTNLTARKTIGELIAMLEFMGWLRQQPTQFNRVYKLSGRLRLNENFLKTNHDTHKNKIVTSKRFWYDRYAYTIQLWSFDFSILEDIFQLFLKIWEFEVNLLVNEHQVHIIETTLYRFLQNTNIPVVEIDGYLGVEGYHGQDGAKVFN